MSGSTSTQSSDTKKKTSSYDRDMDHDKYQIPTAWDAIDLAIHVRIVITRIIQTSIVVDNEMDAGPIEILGPEARRERRLSSREDFDPMVQRYRE